MDLRDRICSIYKSTKKDGMYLYVVKHEGLKNVPEPLLAMFGTPSHVMDLMLKEGRELARVDAKQVLADIHSKGYFLQMPPQTDETEKNNSDQQQS